MLLGLVVVDRVASERHGSAAGILAVLVMVIGFVVLGEAVLFPRLRAEAEREETGVSP